ncbi:multidrug efflux pump accessory protein AcrZ [Salmonella enterica subsp. enterica serovar Choleraesuis]|nr:multidrug efflux pump accessory protein AcrZ [Salmonella enterica subsp. enterica serovar Choleraesuis]
MFELLKSLLFAVLMVPVVMAIILGLIYGLGEVFNVISNAGHADKAGHRDHSRQ